MKGGDKMIKNFDDLLKDAGDDWKLTMARGCGCWCNSDKDHDGRRDGNDKENGGCNCGCPSDEKKDYMFDWLSQH